MKNTKITPAMPEQNGIGISIRNIWTDGSSKGNPGPAGWASLIDGEMYSGYLGVATNNEAEMFAIYNSVIRLNTKDHAEIHTDSKLIIGWFCHGWQINNEKIKATKEIIDELVRTHELILTFSYVPGHSGIYPNTRVDSLAQRVARSGHDI